MIVISLCIIPGNTVLAATSSVSAVPSVSSINPGGNFDLSIKVSSDVETSGMMFAVSWDPQKAECTSVTKGGFYKDPAAANGWSVYMVPGSPAADNTNGRFPTGQDTALNIALTGNMKDDGSGLLGVSGTGEVYVLHMKAKDGVSGTINFTLSKVGLADCTLDVNPLNPTVNNGQVTISNSSSTSPTVSSVAASNVASNSATLNGNLTSMGSETSLSVSFEYGTTTSYGSSTTAQTKTAAGTFYTDIANLAASTTYHFRAKATGASTVNGDDITFTTLAVTTSATTTTTTVTTNSTTSSTTTTPTTNTSTTSTTTPTTTTSSSTMQIVQTTVAETGIRTARSAPTTTRATSQAPAITTNYAQTTGNGNTLGLSTVTDDGGVLQQDTQYRDIRLGTSSSITLIEIKKSTRILAADGKPVEAIERRSGDNPGLCTTRFFNN